MTMPSHFAQDAELHDASYFRLPMHEAAALDPQTRLLLEASAEVSGIVSRALQVAARTVTLSLLGCKHVPGLRHCTHHL